jgi:Family of unknown function (DUF6059)
MFMRPYVLRVGASIRSAAYLTFLSNALTGAVTVSVPVDAAACRQVLEEALRERAARRRAAAEPPPGHPERVVPGTALSDAERLLAAELRPAGGARRWRAPRAATGPRRAGRGSLAQEA